MSGGITAWGTYLPYWRLQRASIASMLGSGGGRGTRAVASYDEDTTTLGVEAARRALAAGPGPAAVQDLFLSTPDPAYLDKTSATTVHAALGLGRAAAAYDFTGSSRSAIATLFGRWPPRPAVARRWPCCRTCAPGWPARPRSATAATARPRSSASSEGAVAELVGRGAASDEFLDRWRVPGETDSHVWEERFGEELYVPLAREAFAASLKDAGLAEGRHRPRHRHRAARAGGQGHGVRPRRAATASSLPT